LAKPAVSVSQFWQITGVFKYQVLTWVGIVGSAITLFANLKGVLNLADWAKELVVHWQEWTQMFWGWVFGWLNIKVPREFVPMISFIVFTPMLIAEVNLSVRAATRSTTPLNGRQEGAKVRRFVRRILLYIIIFFAIGAPFGFDSLLILKVSTSQSEEL